MCGWKGEPSYNTIRAPRARLFTIAFHIIHAHYTDARDGMKGTNGAEIVPLYIGNF
jgi:hypothetical protein